MKPTGALMLLLIRQGRVQDWDSLCRAFDVEPTMMKSDTFWIGEALEKLVEAGLVEIEGHLESRSFKFPAGHIRLAAHATDVQHALGFSLPMAARLRSERTLVVEPFFGTEGRSQGRIDLFMLMPFTKALQPIYDDHIKKVATEMDLVIRRADDFFGAHEIMKDIWGSLLATSAVIADCTGRNPNVFYEIGIAHTIGKPVILITQDEQDVPFDLRAIRYIKYYFTPRGMDEFEETLSSTIRDVFITIASKVVGEPNVIQR